MTETRVVLQAKGLSRHFEDGSRRVQVLDGVDLSVLAGEMVAIVGASGSGRARCCIAWVCSIALTVAN